MGLNRFLSQSEQSHAREEILNNRLLFDLKLAAGSCGYHLQNYYSDVDHDGFDLILDDGVNIRKIQMKSVGSNATTSKWEINRGLLRPAASNLESLGFQLKSPHFDGGRVCWGAEGGVILITYEVDKNNVVVEYRYTDIYIITAISLGILKRNDPTIRCARELRKHLPDGESNEKLKVNAGLFIKAYSPENLLCLAGMKSAVARNWQFMVRALASEEWGPKQKMLPGTLDEFRNGFPEVMKEVSGYDSP